MPGTLMPQSHEARLRHPGTTQPGAGSEDRAACEEAAAFSLQVFYSPARTKAALAVVDSPDKIIVVEFSSASVCHLEINFFLANLFSSPPPPM